MNEHKKSIADFQKPAKKDDEDVWTDEDLLSAAKRIKERLGLDEKLQ